MTKCIYCDFNHPDHIVMMGFGAWQKMIAMLIKVILLILIMGSMVVLAGVCGLMLVDLIKKLGGRDD